MALGVMVRQVRGDPQGAGDIAGRGRLQEPGEEAGILKGARLLGAGDDQLIALHAAVWSNSLSVRYAGR
jgi:hypothetical protein